MTTKAAYIRWLESGSEEDFKIIFHSHYNFLCQLADRFIKDSSVAQDIVVDVFFNLWKLRDRLDENLNLHSYLTRSVTNSCLNYIKSKYKRTEIPFSMIVSQGYVDGFDKNGDGSRQPLGILLDKERLQAVSSAIRNLPEKCGEVFRKSRFEDKSYSQISAELGISINTVKYHIKTALSLLVKELADKDLLP